MVKPLSEPLDPPIDLVSTNVGQTQLLGERHGRRVFSAIRKTAVPSRVTSLYLGYHGLQGDQQTDGRLVGTGGGRPVHGGPLQAVYAFSLAHYAFWASEFGETLALGSFGENLTVGIEEQDVHIGEIWVLGGARLQVTKPRRPCFKLDMHLGGGTSQRMIESGRCGWYLKVLRPGEIPVRGRRVIQIESRLMCAMTIRQEFLDKMRRDRTVPDLHIED